MVMAAVVSTGGVGAVLGFKRFVHRVHDQMHRTQHVGQHVVRLECSGGRAATSRWAHGGCPGGKPRGSGRRCARLAAVGDFASTACGAASATMSEPSSATSTSPPRTTVPRGRKNADLAALAVGGARKRLFWRTSQSSSTVAARLTRTGARPWPWGMRLETWSISIQANKGCRHCGPGWRGPRWRQLLGHEKAARVVARSQQRGRIRQNPRGHRALWPLQMGRVSRSPG